MALASLYENGVGVPLDIDKARHYYTLSAAQGSRYAADRLAFLAGQPPAEPKGDLSEPQEQPRPAEDVRLRQTTEAVPVR